MAKFRLKEKGKGKGKGKDGGKGKKGKGKDKLQELAEDETYMDEAEFAAWLHGPLDEYTNEGMQCLTERGGGDSAAVTVPGLDELCGADGGGVNVTQGGFPVTPTDPSTDGCRATEIIGMMADMVLCQTCRQHVGQYLGPGPF